MLILVAVVLFLIDQNRPSASKTESLVPTCGVYFSLRGGPTSAITKTLDQARKSVLVQAYSFTSIPIAEALVRAQGRGVTVRAILDRSQKVEEYSAAGFLSKHGINIGVDAAQAIAHLEAKVVTERWRKHYNTVRPHSSLQHRPPAPETYFLRQVADA